MTNYQKEDIVALLAAGLSVRDSTTTPTAKDLKSANAIMETYLAEVRNTSEGSIRGLITNSFLVQTISAFHSEHNAEVKALSDAVNRGNSFWRKVLEGLVLAVVISLMVWALRWTDAPLDSLLKR